MPRRLVEIEHFNRTVKRPLVKGQLCNLHDPAALGIWNATLQAEVQRQGISSMQQKTRAHSIRAISQVKGA